MSSTSVYVGKWNKNKSSKSIRSGLHI